MKQLRHDRHRPILDPAEIYLTPAEFRDAFLCVAADRAAHVRVAA